MWETDNREKTTKLGPNPRTCENRELKFHRDQSGQSGGRGGAADGDKDWAAIRNSGGGSGCDKKLLQASEQQRPAYPIGCWKSRKRKEEVTGAAPHVKQEKTDCEWSVKQEERLHRRETGFQEPHGVHGALAPGPADTTSLDAHVQWHTVTTSVHVSWAHPPTSCKSSLDYLQYLT